MAILGGSPLGLIGVKSTPSRTGMSTFNAGNTRNVNIFYYNTGKDPNYNKGKGGMYSLLSHKGVVRPWPNIGKIGASSELPGTFGDAKYKGDKRSILHQNSTYDTSILNIIESLAETPANLRPADFAYLKDIGVYPNNRLMIARRFAAPVGNNIYTKSKKGGRARPIATLISWKPQGEDFLDINFGEEWENAKGDFTSMITKLGEDFMGGKLGKKAGGLLGSLPLPGFTEKLQRQFLADVGILKNDGQPLPAGDPNLIKIAKRRKTIDYGKAGSGLKCTIGIKMTCVYEQKFISGIDPTIVWKDIISNILSFGSSVSRDYGLSSGASQTLLKWARNPSLMISQVATTIKNGLSAALDTVKEEVFKLKDAERDQKLKAAKDQEKVPDPESEEAKIKRESKAEKAAFESFIGQLRDVSLETVSATIQKYKEEVQGIIFALSGMPSTPWHITIGNPLRPVFSSGDMITDDVKLKLGPDLAFNDLPARITVEFTLKNARPLGIQEIMARFNTGYIRSIDPPETSTTATGDLPDKTENDNGSGKQVYDKEKPAEESTDDTNGQSTNSNNNAGDDNKNSGKSTENSTSDTINSDPNSEGGPVEKEGAV